ncbi:YihY/virulence factor BrkB family protein [Rhabdothermincola salaria]|uniref:YihY/virulence factor BrkB family protein n=1 Tax=Rhabdothermincola salaria TaxID=2903142 RepID=UPI001E483FE8|nr:YihY/virulence factor BrkB family protein [Rhabdothermincola salaria]MCD9623394.1 YihY/virulence factor BrkB family protein [Rhabdothermincola salaria]
MSSPPAAASARTPDRADARAGADPGPADERSAPASTGPEESTDWRSVAMRVKGRVRDDNVVLLAAGVAFFGLFAVFPALVALVSIYGLVSDPSDVARQVENLAAGLPEASKEFLDDQLNRIVETSPTGLGVALVVSLVVALWSASSGIGHLTKAVRAAYGEAPRTFVQARLRALGMAVGAVVLLAVLFGVLTVVPPLVREASDVLGSVVAWLRWPLVALVFLAAMAVLYRIAPAAEDARWRWFSPGSLVATAIWLLGSAGLALYASRVADLEATYGTMGSVLVLMLWLLLSALAVIVGAMVDADVEHIAPRSEEDAAG